MRRRASQWLARGRSVADLCLPAFLLFLLTITVLSPSRSLARDEPEVSEPKLLSVFPLAGQRGSTVKAEVRGDWLDGAYAVWFDSGAFKAQVLRVEDVKGEVKQRLSFLAKPKKSLSVYRALIDVRIEPTAPLGIHSLRLVSPRGVSNALRFRVADEPVVPETEGSHQTTDQAQSVTIPVVISGKLGKPAELDYYSFHAQRGQELRFEAVRGEEPGEVEVEEQFGLGLALYQAGGSWFVGLRPTRLLFQEERSSDLIPVGAEGTYRFSQDGQYFLEVSGLYGEGCPDCTYLVRIASNGGPFGSEARSRQPEPEWTERSFSRKLEDGWTKALKTRAVDATDQSNTGAKIVASNQAGGAGPSADQGPARVPGLLAPPSLVGEREPNDRATQAQEIAIPSVVEGAIGHPGDVDSFKFAVKPGEKLAFEVETPGAKPPYFNPRFGVVDSQDRELFSNVHWSISLFNANADKHAYLKGVEPKVIYTFENGGDYLLQIRDITSRYGGPDYRYRILIRPQIPHVGEVSVTEGDHINLVRGEAKKLTITTSYEEAFAGEVSFTFTGLPEGVQAFPGAELNDNRAPGDVDANPDIVAPKQQKTTIVLLARSEAQVSSVPKLVHLICQPIVKGKLGSSILVRVIPLMVVEGTQQKQEEKQP